MSRYVAVHHAILVACHITPALRGQQPAKSPAAEPLLKVEGELTRADPVDPVLKKGFHKVYAVKLTAGTYYQIDLVSKDFDAYLRLEDETGKQVSADDNSGGELNARIVFHAGKSREYRIIATTAVAGARGMADKKLRSVLQLDEKLFARRDFLSGKVGERIGAGARSPLVLSGLVCAGANLPDTPERGILSADAIAGLVLDDLHLAVLSACDTGLGDVAGGEGVFGLQRAFHIAGCKNVVASLWKVDDAATAALMVRFYGYLFQERRGQETPAERGLPPIEALRRAQLDLYRHPELIPTWAKGEERGPVRPRPATAPLPADTPRELVTSDGRAPIRLRGAFTLSGAGR